MPGCDRIGRVQRGWCERHYSRWRKHGDPLGGRVPVGERLAFFEAALLIDTDECVDWPDDAAASGFGYGRLTIDGVDRDVHVWACERTHGPRPFPRAQVRHTCGRPACFNPRHLRWGTARQNAHDRIAHGTAGIKLSADQAAAIRAIEGRTQSDIAHEFGISQSMVSRIRRGLSW